MNLCETAPNCPCKDCKDRQVNCHSNCKKYIEWSIKNEELRKKVLENKTRQYYGMTHLNKLKRKVK